MTTVGVTRFELAFRRALFLLILLAVYLVFGTVLFWVLSQSGGGRPAAGNSPFTRAQLALQERMDFERTELLVVLWAESISRTEQDWSLLANQKLDAYEKLLVAEGAGGGVTRLPAETRTFSHAFRHAFLVVTTIGGIDASVLTDATSLSTILYALLGIPLFCLYLDQCVNAVAALLPGSESARSLNRVYFLAAGAAIVGVAVALDVAECNDEDTPFLDVVFNVFLAASTIGGFNGRTLTARRGAIASLIFYGSATVLIATLRVALQNIQRRVERLIGGYEFEFTQKVGQLERAISGNRLDHVAEEDEEEADEYRDDSEIVDPATVPKINVDYSRGVYNSDRATTASILMKQKMNEMKRPSDHSYNDDSECVHFNFQTSSLEEEDGDNEHESDGREDEPTATAAFRQIAIDEADENQ